MTALAKHLDDNNTGSINISKWKAEFIDDSIPLFDFEFTWQGSHLNYLRDVISKYNLQIDDILRRMEINRNSILSLQDLIEGLVKLDPSLDRTKAFKLAKDIIKTKESVPVNQLMVTLGCSLGNIPFSLQSFRS